MGRRDRQADRRSTYGPHDWGRALRSAPTASASSPHPMTRRRGCGTPRPASRSASSKATNLMCEVRRSIPTADALRPRPMTRPPGCGTARPASRSRALGHDHPLRSAVFSPDGKRIVTIAEGGMARVWTVFPDTRQLVAHAKAIVPRCLTSAQRAAYSLPPEPPAWCIEMAKWPYHTAGWRAWLTDTRAGKNPPLPAPPAQ